MVSIIIPIYNVKQYIIACLKSVEAQTYTDYEVILVDDCGTDGSMKIVEDFIYDNTNKNNEKYRILRNEVNLGPSAARNLGTSSAQGTYVFYLDSDDTITPECLEKLVQAAEIENADITVGNFRLVGDDKYIPRFCGDVATCTYDAFRDYLQGKYFLMIWNKLVKRSLIEQNQICFPVGIHHGEDAAWSFSLACVANKVAYVNDITYYYYIRTDGLHIKDSFQNFLTSYIFLIKHYSKTVLKYGKDDDPEFRWWYEKQKALHFKQTMMNGTMTQQKELYAIIRKNLPQGAWNKQQVHYLLPSFLGILVYKKWCGMWLV